MVEERIDIVTTVTGSRTSKSQLKEVDAAAEKLGHDLIKMGNNANTSAGLFSKAFKSIGGKLNPTMILSGLVGGLAAGGAMAIGSKLADAIGGAFSSRMKEINDTDDRMTDYQQKIIDLTEKRAEIVEKMRKIDDPDAYKEMVKEVGNLEGEYVRASLALNEVKTQQDLILQQTNIPYENALEGVNKACEELRTAFTPLLELAVPGLEQIISLLQWLTYEIEIVAALIDSTTTDTGTKIQDLINLVLGLIIDAVQTIVGWVRDIYKVLIGVGNSLAEGIANALIDGINYGLSKAISAVNDFLNWLRSIPYLGEQLKGVKPLTYTPLQHVDFSEGTAKAQGLSDEFFNWFIETLEKGQTTLGWTQEQIANKYGVIHRTINPLDSTIPSFGGGLPALTKAVNKNTAAVNKNTDKQAKVEIYLTNTFNAPYNEQDMYSATKQTTDAIVNGLKKGGIVV